MVLYECVSCDQHPPHIVGFYDTVSMGTLQRFCPGIPGKHVEITVDKERHGDALTTSLLEGHYLIQEV